MLIRQTLRYAPAQLLGPLAQFVGVVAWTHMLQPAEYGLVLLILALQELGFVLSLFWWSSYTLRYLSATQDRRAYQRSENGVLLVAGLAQIPIMLAGLASVGHLFDGPLIVATLTYAITRATLTQFSERARAVGDITAYSIAKTVAPLVGLPIGLGLMHVMPAILAITWGFAVVQIVTIPILVRRLGIGFEVSLRLDDHHLRSAMSYGGPLLIAGAFDWVSTNGMRFIVEHQEGAVALGLVSVGWNLGQRIMSLLASLVTAAAFPLAVKSFEEHGLKASLAQLTNNSLLLIGLLVPAALGIAAVVVPVTTLMVGADYRSDTIIILPIAAAAAAIRNIRLHFADQVFLVTAEPRFILWLDGVEAVATVVCCALGLWYGGLAGACFGCMVGYLVGAVMCFSQAIRRYELELPLRATLSFGFASVAMAAVLRFSAFPVTWVGLSFQVAVGSLIYAGLSFVLMRDPISQRRLRMS